MNARLDPIHADPHAEFADDVVQGLSGHPKQLPCKWFYDFHGSDLFEQITRTPEYYPTRVESRLMREHMADITRHLTDIDVIVEPGSGSSVKTRLLLAALPALQAYVPMDISADFLMDSARSLAAEFPRLTIEPMVADFSRLATRFPLQPGQRPLVYFPGSTIGNFSPDDAVALLRDIRLAAGTGASLLIGVDMTQDVSRLVPAYDDAAGVTAAFNLNLLERMRRELHADIDPARFAHRAIFNRAEQRIEMHLVSRGAQTVHVRDRRFDFADGETIHTENAYKYPRTRFLDLAATSGWRFDRLWQDTVESAFTIVLLRSVS